MRGGREREWRGRGGERNVRRGGHMGQKRGDWKDQEGGDWKDQEKEEEEEDNSHHNPTPVDPQEVPRKGFFYEVNNKEYAQLNGTFLVT